MFFTELLTEAIYGNVATLYHRTKDKDGFMKALKNHSWVSGLAAGALYGGGIYTCFDFPRRSDIGNPDYDPAELHSASGNTRYGKYVIKMAVKGLHNFFCFSFTDYKKINPSTKATRATFIQEQNEKFGLNVKLPNQEEVVGDLRSFEDFIAKYHFENRRCKGLIFTGHHDGKVCIVFDPYTVTPLGYVVDEEGYNKEVNDHTKWLPLTLEKTNVEKEKDHSEKIGNSKLKITSGSKGYKELLKLFGGDESGVKAYKGFIDPNEKYIIVQNEVAGFTLIISFDGNYIFAFTKTNGETKQEEGNYFKDKTPAFDKFIKGELKNKIEDLLKYKKRFSKESYRNEVETNVSDAGNPKNALKHNEATYLGKLGSWEVFKSMDIDTILKYAGVPLRDIPEARDLFYYRTYHDEIQSRRVFHLIKNTSNLNNRYIFSFNSSQEFKCDRIYRNKDGEITTERIGLDVIGKKIPKDLLKRIKNYENGNNLYDVISKTRGTTAEKMVDRYNRGVEKAFKNKDKLIQQRMQEKLAKADRRYGKKIYGTSSEYCKEIYKDYVFGNKTPEKVVDLNGRKYKVYTIKDFSPNFFNPATYMSSSFYKIAKINGKDEKISKAFNNEKAGEFSWRDSDNSLDRDINRTVKDRIGYKRPGKLYVPENLNEFNEAIIVYFTSDGMDNAILAKHGNVIDAFYDPLELKEEDVAAAMKDFNPKAYAKHSDYINSYHNYG